VRGRRISSHEGEVDLTTALSSTDVFAAALRGLHTVPYVCNDAKSTVDVLRTIVGESDAKVVVAGGLPNPAQMLVEAGLRGTRHYFVEGLKPSEAVGIVSKADVGISWARYGAARHGALVEVASDDIVKLVSSLPRVSVFLLSTQNLLPDLSAAMAKVGEIIRSAGDNKPVISIVSGPSKTADIELRLLYGVHGPHELHVLLLDWI
jgi:L-lactate dehydrogenase complex protein LldG